LAEPYIGEIRIFAFGKIPQGWLPCNGQALPISQFQALYAIMGTTYGGDGINNFCIPNLQGRVPVHPGSGISVGQSGGVEKHRLLLNEIPKHRHQAMAGADVATTGATSPKGKTWGTSYIEAYAEAHDGTMKTEALEETGLDLPHNNMQPYQVFQYCMAIEGLFPPRN